MLLQFQDKPSKSNHRLLGRAAWQFAAIFVLAACIGLSINRFRDNRLSLFADRHMESPMKTASGARMDISLIEAKNLFLRHAAVFIDARPKEDFENGHIKGAKSLPWHEVDRNFVGVMENIPDDATIITYCDGEACELSRHLAKFLMDAGFSHVRILQNGWTKWREAHLPAESKNDG